MMDELRDELVVHKGYNSIVLPRDNQVQPLPLLPTPFPTPFP